MSSSGWRRRGRRCTAVANGDVDQAAVVRTVRVDLAGAHGGVLANAFKGTPTRFCLMSFTSDWLFPTSESRATVRALGAMLAASPVAGFPQPEVVMAATDGSDQAWQGQTLTSALRAHRRQDAAAVVDAGHWFCPSSAKDKAACSTSFRVSVIAAARPGSKGTGQSASPSVCGSSR